MTTPATTKPQPTTDDLTVELVRWYLATMQGNASRLAAIIKEADACQYIHRHPTHDEYDFAKLVFRVEQEHFTFVPSLDGTFNVRAATPEEAALLQ